MSPRDASGSLRIVVLGYLVRGPLGGHAWHHLHYAAGLARLGHDVWFVEDSDDYPSCYDPVRDVVDADPTYGLAFAERAFERIGLESRWAYHDAHSRRWHGPAAEGAVELCQAADLVLNLSGANPLRDWVAAAPARVLVDTDPGFTQAEHLRDPSARERAQGHTAFFTFAENVGSSASLPDDGLPWRPTRQPVVLALWPQAPPPPREAAFTTVMLWDSYSAVEVDGRELGMKSASFAPVLDLPMSSRSRLQLALGGSTAPRDLLAEHGWDVLDSRVPTQSLESYRRYIESSRGELSVAKHGYVVTCSGWFSERSANYLATGRPVVTEDTGFSSVLPTGDGLLAFSTADEALEALVDVEQRYAVHCRAAREIAEEYFDSDRVLEQLVAASLQSRAGTW